MWQSNRLGKTNTRIEATTAAQSKSGRVACGIEKKMAHNVVATPLDIDNAMMGGAAAANGHGYMPTANAAGAPTSRSCSSSSPPISSPSTSSPACRCPCTSKRRCCGRSTYETRPRYMLRDLNATRILKSVLAGGRPRRHACGCRGPPPISAGSKRSSSSPSSPIGCP